jgi:hypothetical protein
LSEDSDTALSIDASTGEVTLTADPNYETQSQYSFSVIATDAAGNVSESQSVTLDINNLDELTAATQHVYVSSSTTSEDGTQETVVVSYNADASTTGLGLRIHFDSSVLTFNSVPEVMTNSLITPVLGDLVSDIDDLDGDGRTDKYVQFGWASLFGGWPSAPSALPANLMSLTFDLPTGSTGSSVINFTDSSHAAGFAFDGQSHEVAFSL